MGRPSDRIASTPVLLTLGTTIPRAQQSALVLTATGAGSVVVSLEGGDMTILLEANKTLVLQDVEVLKVTAGTATGIVAYVLR